MILPERFRRQRFDSTNGREMETGGIPVSTPKQLRSEIGMVVLISLNLPTAHDIEVPSAGEMQ